MDIRSEKEALRREALAQRRALSPEEVRQWSAAIAERVWSLKCIRDTPTLLSYVDSRDNEVQTRGIIAGALGAGKEVLVPISVPGGGMSWSVLRGIEDLVAGRFSIGEPAPHLRQYRIAPSGAPCLVPGIAFSQLCQRVGHGYGFFDRFLSENSVFSIGLAFNSQIRDSLPIEAHDVPLAIVVTETTEYRRAGVTEI